jgi:hypothetical protein
LLSLASVIGAIKSVIVIITRSFLILRISIF